MIERQLRKLTAFGYRHRGAARIAEAVRRHYACHDTAITIDDFDGDIHFNCRLDDHITSQIFWRGAYSSDQLPALARMLCPGMIFADIGANCGEFTLFAAKRLTQGHVFAFEPASAHRHDLLANIALNGFNNITIIDRGLSDHEGRAAIYSQNAPFTDGTRHRGLHTLYPQGQRQDMLEHITLSRLDDIMQERAIPRIDIMKIDVEGAELPILRGARRTLDQFHPIIFIEISSVTAQAAGYDAKDILSELATHGYGFQSIAPDGTLRTLSTADIGEYQNVICYTGALP